VMQEAARRIAEGGRIINMGTTLLAATTGMYGVYAGSKAPLEAFTRALAKEIGSRGVTVNTVCPGPIDTPFYHSQENEQSVAYVTRMSVANRLGTIDDVVPLIEFLASPKSQWMTAQTLFINGGYLAR
jgi:NAD(P)-dependent dehydrogenase (short-subunit alcohol dehydrogenase family)